MNLFKSIDIWALKSGTWFFRTVQVLNESESALHVSKSSYHHYFSSLTRTNCSYSHQDDKQSMHICCEHIFSHHISILVHSAMDIFCHEFCRSFTIMKLVIIQQYLGNKMCINCHIHKSTFACYPTFKNQHPKYQPTPFTPKSIRPLHISP